MTDLMLETALDTLPHLWPGPGGVAGVVRDGRVIAARAWGHADVTTPHPMTRGTRMPICSISKQFTCGVLLAAIGDPAVLDARVRGLLPGFTADLPTTQTLCDNQSGLRDYWALTILHGARAEQTFSRADALPLLARMRTGHFAPGTSYSYCNANFRILSEMIEAETGQPLEDLYRRHIWDPAGMETAALTPDTRFPADGVIGYEGTPDTGHFPADNRIFWIGDAGISASLDDMLAYETWIDATRNDPQGIYRRLSAVPHFRDGRRAAYGFGLAHETIGRVDFTGHSGALRGFRAHRMNARAERLSVVVMFNHEADAHGAAAWLARAALGVAPPAAPPLPDGWDGQYLDAERGLIARIGAGRDAASLRYATTPARLTATAGGLTGAGVTVTRDGHGLIMDRPGENAVQVLTPLPVLTHADGAEIAGRYHAPEVDAIMVIEARDGGIYACFDGMMGRGRMERMAPAGPDVWILATRRSMDAPAPGDWTFVPHRDAQGRVTGGRLGCWLARGVAYDRIG